MAGSLKWFRYLADDNTPYAILADESNTEAVNTVLTTNASVAGLVPLPKGYTARYVTLETNDGTFKRKAYVLDPDRYAILNNTQVFQIPLENSSTGAQVKIVLKQAEKLRRQPKDADTGINDGDNP